MMEFIDLGRQYDEIKEQLNLKIQKVLNSHHYIMGEEIIELEKRLAKYVGREFCLTCGSGTEALIIPLMAYDLKESDAVFVPAFTFFASAESISLAGGKPVFVDVDDTFNMSITSLEEQIERVLKEGKLVPKGIMPVDLFGRSADYDKIIPIAEKYGLFVIEDAAQGFGGTLRGKKNGSFGDVSATSFFPAKPLGCYGDGGAIFTDDIELYNKMKSIRVHGSGTNRYDNVRIGINGRMDTIQAAVVLTKLDIFDDELKRRQEIAEMYSKELENTIVVPRMDEDHCSAWAQYTLRAKDEKQREVIMAELKRKDIPTMIYYPKPLHKQTVYKEMGYDQELECCQKLAEQVFSVPMHPYITKD